MIRTPVEAQSAMEQSVAYLLDQGNSLAEIEYLVRQSVLQQALIRTRGNQCKAARKLGVHRNTLSRERASHEIPIGYGRKMAAASVPAETEAARRFGGMR